MDYVQWIRPKIGNTKIFLICANGVIFNENNQILLMRRADFGSWATPGGALDFDEDIVTCLRREVREETGLEITAIELVEVVSEPAYDVLYPNGDQTQQYTINFRARAAGGTLQMLDGEATDLRWFDQNSLPVSEMFDWYVQMVRNALRTDLPLVAAPVSSAVTRESWNEVRKIVGHERLLLPGAVVVVRNDEGRVLLGKRADTKTWWFPAGFVMLGENASHAAVREVREETGLEVEIVRLLGVVSGARYQHVFPNGDKVQGTSATFLARPVGGNMQPDIVETTDLIWATLDEAAELTQTHHFGFLFPHYRRVLDSGTFCV